MSASMKLRTLAREARRLCEEVGEASRKNARVGHGTLFKLGAVLADLDAEAARVEQVCAEMAALCAETVASHE